MFNRCCFSAIVLVIAYSVCAQNVGVNTLYPNYPLTVGSNANGNGIGIYQEDPNGWVNIHTRTANNGGWLKSNSTLHLATNNSAAPAMTLFSGRVGIGLGGSTPTYTLDLGGRLRLRHNTSMNTTAGLFLDAPGGLNSRSFIGTINDDHVGIFGTGGANWNFSMNVVNGNTGIGTASPTAKLDINGTLRIRGSMPQKGSVLVSADANGNASWQEFIGFRTTIFPDTFYTKQNVPANTWTKVVFPNSFLYNYGLGYQPWLSQFVAPVKGIYHFEAQISIAYFNSSWVRQAGLGLAGTRNGVGIPMPYQQITSGTISVSGDTPFVDRPYHLSLSTDLLLEAGDIIWLKVYSATSETIMFAYDDVNFFSGRLVTPL